MNQPEPMTTGVASRPVVASFPDYAQAQRAVDQLSDAKFPVQLTAIIGSDLKMVEVVHGRLSWGRAALQGLGAGAWFGLLVGLLLGLFVDSAQSWLALLLWGVFYGAVFGVVFGLVSYAFSGGRRDFVSTSQLVASSYDVVCAADKAEEAKQVLGRSAGSPGSGAPPAA